MISKPRPNIGEIAESRSLQGARRTIRRRFPRYFLSMFQVQVVEKAHKSAGLVHLLGARIHNQALNRSLNRSFEWKRFCERKDCLSPTMDTQFLPPPMRNPRRNARRRLVARVLRCSRDSERLKIDLSKWTRGGDGSKVALVSSYDSPFKCRPAPPNVRIRSKFRNFVCD